MNIVTRPFYWISAHREATFTFDYEHVYDITGSADVGGKVAFAFDSDGINALEVGDYLFVDSGIYKGLHKVTELFTPNIYITATNYISAITSGTLRFIEDHIFTIGAGYTYPAELAELLPYSIVATFKPEVNNNGQLVVNISGYINKLFDVINSNDTVTIGGREVYYNLFNRVVLFIDDVQISEHIALNASITQYELNRDYVDTGRDLNGGNLGNHYLSCGDSDAIRIEGDYVIRAQEYTPTPILSGKKFKASDFNTSQFITE